MADRTMEAAVRENVAAERRYLESCSELSSAISTLESAVTAFVGKDRGDIKVFAQTRARLESELAEDRVAQLSEVDVVIVPRIDTAFIVLGP
ncbi:hypothetical protein Ctob_005733 [Chrysochromulina tobinii]|uniref:Uncharacterized protein n=1 Tax=Chrysochromulina tobinii TaxID=1460289 RepID=A0A0M0JB37_9EUKA|nr:hypothetical protein Ctob_005733 [Chrysochromulina tobinii]|eukprot:KOO23562.1 hypothetical protein Ctob_005733 [Chrysochromulina sp. CCMP291]